MHVTVVYIHVKPEHVADFVEAIHENHERSVLEPGNLRFDILQSADDATRFVTYMAYVDEASANAHRETAHYRAFRDLVADWMVEPRRNVPYEGLFPAVDQDGEAAPPTGTTRGSRPRRDDPRSAPRARLRAG